MGLGDQIISITNLTNSFIRIQPIEFTLSIIHQTSSREVLLHQGLATCAQQSVFILVNPHKPIIAISASFIAIQKVTYKSKVFYVELIGKRELGVLAMRGSYLTAFAIVVKH
jgi:hypothetical protein